ncbi:MAG: HAMP domain-containing sensor histidine kinase [Saprospiraceae bacterium]
MFTDRSFLLARALMAASLLLLGCSLAWFLHRTYREEETALSREVGFIFINTVRNIEGGLVNKLVFRRTQEGIPEFTPLNREIRHDSVRVMTFVGQGMRTTEIKHDQQFEIRLSQSGSGDLPSNELTGSISMFVAMSGDSLVRDSVRCIAPDSEAFFRSLKTDFDRALRKAGLPLEHRINRLKPGETSEPEKLMSGLYTDVANGERYGAELSGYHLFLLRKMLPQILFALLLFGCVTLAFFFVFRTLRAQRRLTALKTEFIQNISHELKTPIATMSVAFEALRDFDALKNPGQTREYLDISRLELQRLSLLVEKVLGIAQLERTDAALATTVFDFRELADEILATLRPRFEQAGATVEYSNEGTDFRVKGDRLHLAGVLYNLLDNALKYGGDKPAIHVLLRAEGEKMTLRVHDSGPGIPEAYRLRIFEAFFRVPSEAGHQVKGHGLGLSYSAKVVEQHGGTIALDPEHECGTAFTVELPSHG